MAHASDSRVPVLLSFGCCHRVSSSFSEFHFFSFSFFSPTFFFIPHLLLAQFLDFVGSAGLSLQRCLFRGAACIASAREVTPGS